MEEKRSNASEKIGFKEKLKSIRWKKQHADKAARRKSSTELKSIIEIDMMEKAASRKSSTKLKSIIEIESMEQAARRKKQHEIEIDN